MKKIALATLLVILVSAGAAQACGDRIFDIQTDPVNHAPGTLGVPCDVIVTAVRSIGFWGQQVPTGAEPATGEYSGIWVYTGGDPGLAPGDIVSICGEIKEYFDMTEIDVVSAGLYGYVLQTGSGAPLAPYVLTAAQVIADGEPWESVQITIQDGMEVPPGFDLGFGEWNVIALDGTVLIFDDYFYNFADVMEGQCYNNATGIYTYTFGAFKLEPYADGIPIVNCAVGVEDISLGSVKAMFR
ncbi:hypothetical protein KDM41_11170 [bacterium]|nr:hypothetical protein [bacterium]